jgi:glycosyltransferase involved in cell wall biosynthesis
MLTILFVTRYALTYPLSDGGSIRQWNMLRGLLRAGKTDALFVDEQCSLDSEVVAGCVRVFVVNGRYFGFTELQRRQYASTIGRGVLTLGTMLPYRYLIERQREFQARVLDQIDFADYDVVWFSDPSEALALRDIVKGPKTMVDADDLEYLREWSLLNQYPWYGAKIWNYINAAKLYFWEQSLPRWFDCVIRCSEADRLRHPAPNVSVIHNGADIPEMCTRRQGAGRVLFVGSLSYAPNVHGMQWFLSNVWPVVRRQVPTAALDLVGRGPTADLLQSHGREGISVHGVVKDVTPFYESATVSVVPLLAAGGTRLKILESLAREVPVVSTTIGAFGLGTRKEHGVLLADHPEIFAKRCIDALQNPAALQASARNGREWVRQHYDWRVIREQVARLAQSIVSAKRKQSANRHRVPHEPKAHRFRAK